MNQAREQVEAMVAEALARGAGVEVQAPGRDLYLDLAENVVRQASAWQMADGTIGDPHNAPGVESVTATAVQTSPKRRSRSGIGSCRRSQYASIGSPSTYSRAR